MNADSAFRTLATHVQSVEDSADRLVLLEALSVLALHAKLLVCLDQTEAVIAALRTADNAQLVFRDFLASPQP